MQKAYIQRKRYDADGRRRNTNSAVSHRVSVDECQGFRYTNAFTRIGFAAIVAVAFPECKRCGADLFYCDRMDRYFCLSC